MLLEPGAELGLPLAQRRHVFLVHALDVAFEHVELLFRRVDLLRDLPLEILRRVSHGATSFPSLTKLAVPRPCCPSGRLPIDWMRSASLSRRWPVPQIF